MQGRKSLFPLIFSLQIRKNALLKGDFFRTSLHHRNTGVLTVLFVGVHTTADQVAVIHNETCPVGMGNAVGTGNIFFHQNGGLHTQSTCGEKIFANCFEGAAGIKHLVHNQNVAVTGIKFQKENSEPEAMVEISPALALDAEDVLSLVSNRKIELSQGQKVVIE